MGSAVVEPINSSGALVGSILVQQLMLKSFFVSRLFQWSQTCGKHSFCHIIPGTFGLENKWLRLMALALMTRFSTGISYSGEFSFIEGP